MPKPIAVPIVDAPAPGRETKRLYGRATTLALITIFYNLVEGLVSVGFGMADETLALFGFGLDSFVEVVSGLGIWHMVRRLRATGPGDPDRFERRALRVTGSAFLVLAAGLALTAALNLYSHRAPETTVAGVIVALVSILTMWLLIRAKTRVGRALRSDAILADAACTRTCLQLSVVLLAASAGYELTGIGGLDAVGSLVIAAIAAREGREAFQKAAGRSCGCAGACSS